MELLEVTMTDSGNDSCDRQGQSHLEEVSGVHESVPMHSLWWCQRQETLTPPSTTVGSSLRVNLILNFSVFCGLFVSKNCVCVYVSMCACVYVCACTHAHTRLRFASILT